MKVKRLVFRQMGTYNDVALRTYHTHHDGVSASDLVDATNGGRDISPTVLAGLAGRIMRPSAEAGGVAPIASGWGEERLMFLMEVVIRESANSQVLQIVSGYTNFNGATQRLGRTDETVYDSRMELRFNSTLKVRSMPVIDRGGRQWHSNIYDSSQIITRQEAADFRSADFKSGTITVRPEDLFVKSTVSKEFSEIAKDSGFHDMRSGFNRRCMKLSSRHNTQATQYLSRTLRALRDSAPTDFIDHEDTNGQMVDARKMVKEQQIQNDAVFEEIAKYSNIMNSGYVTFGELLDMNPDLAKIAKYYPCDKAQRFNHRGEVERWGGNDNETVASTIISQSMPQILMDTMYGEMKFSATNRTSTGEFEIKVSSLTPFNQEADIDENFNTLLARLQHEMLADLIINRDMTVDVEVHCTIFGDTTIWISIDGDDEAEFVYPTFADATASPIITDQEIILDTLAKDIRGISTSLRSGAPSTRKPRGNFL